MHFAFTLEGSQNLTVKDLVLYQVKAYMALIIRDRPFLDWLAGFCEAIGLLFS